MAKQPRKRQQGEKLKAVQPKSSSSKKPTAIKKGKSGAKIGSRAKKESQAASMEKSGRSETMAVTDWQRNKELLLENSDPLVRALIAENKKQGDVIAAIGYVFEFGTGQLCFELCANTARNAKESLARYLTEWPKESADEFRWNSGNYDYPGAVQDHFGGWSEALWDELSRLDRLAQDEEQSKIVHKHVADICCEVLAELAGRGLLGDWSNIDFNVSVLLDQFGRVKQRNERIRKLIKSIASEQKKGTR